MAVVVEFVAVSIHVGCGIEKFPAARPEPFSAFTLYF